MVRAALVFPHVGEQPWRRVRSNADWAARQPLWLPGEHCADGWRRDAVEGVAVPVRRLMVDYPQPTKALRSDGAWRAYISEVGAELVDLLSAGVAGRVRLDSGRASLLEGGPR